MMSRRTTPPLLGTALCLVGAALLGCTTHVHTSAGSSPASPTSTSTTTTATTPSTQTTTPTVTGAMASIVVAVDCGTGAARVTVVYGTAPPEEHQVGSGATPTFRGRYGTMPGFADSTLQVITKPTRGTCKTTLTSHSSGDIVAASQSSSESTLTAVISAGQ